jgi:alanine racemase
MRFADLQAKDVSELQVWADIDLAAYGHNIRGLKQIASPGAQLMAVVKANGYGHGAVEVSRVAIDSGATWLGVARLHEAVELRGAGIEAPILIFGATPPEMAEHLLVHNLTQAVFSTSTARAFSDRAQTLGRTLRVHIKVDTGMGRLGLLLDDARDGIPAADPSEHALDQVLEIAALPGLEIAGLFSHYATADSADKAYARYQLARFRKLAATLHSRGLDIPIKHTANSAALIDLPDSHLDLVRPGIATYGLYPSHEVDLARVDLRPVLQWKTRIIQLKQVPAGFGVSYGITYRTPRPTTLATVAVGYADGLSRSLSSRGEMLVGGRRVPIVGRICMDLTLLDVGEVPDATVGDEVVIIGRQGDEELTADEMATTLGTISYEIVTSIANRVPRVYNA